MRSGSNSDDRKGESRRSSSVDGRRFKPSQLDEKIDGKSLMVRNLHYDTKRESIFDFFCRIAPVKDVYVPRDQRTNKPRGFGFVEFESSSDAERAVNECNGKELDGRILEMNIAQDRRKSKEEMRGRYGSRYRSNSRGRRHSRSRSRSRGRRHSRSRSRRHHSRRHRSSSRSRSH